MNTIKHIPVPLFFLIILASCEEILFEEDLSAKKVLLVEPANHRTLPIKTALFFSWQNLESASEYQLQIASPDFSLTANIQLDVRIDTLNYTLDSLPKKSYQWRVKALNSEYESAFSTQNFTVENLGN